MVRILLIAHTPLASAFAEAARHAFADVDAGLQAMDVAPDEPREITERRARDLIAQWQSETTNTPVEVLVLSDVFGATPCNVAQRLAEGSQVRCLAGVNVPMLWRALNYRHETLDQVAQKAMAGGQQGVVAVGLARPPQNQTLPPIHAQDANHDQQ